MTRALSLNEIIPAPIEEVWHAFSTEEGVVTFFAPKGLIDLRPGGAYEMYFDLEAPAGSRGGEGCLILAIEPMAMLSLTWNAPPEIPTVRNQRTHVTIRFESISTNQTRVTLRHDGWGGSIDWLRAKRYFRRAWGKVVIPRLKQRFLEGPINWNNH